MNEIEETLLIIFLEENNRLNENIFGWHKLGVHVYQEEWNHFRFQELGRTLPDEYEYYASDFALECMRAHEVIDIHLTKKPLDRWKNKIKITVVEE